MHGVCISHRIHRAWIQQGCETGGRSRHQNHCKIVKNIKEMNANTIRGKSPKQVLTSANN